MLVSTFVQPPTRAAARRYSCNEDYFTQLSSESAYWLGFIMADGNVYVRWRRHSDKHPQFVFSLCSNDVEHLEYFRSCIASTHPIRNSHHNVHVIHIISYPLCFSLEKWGVVPAKSKILQFPKLPDKELERHLFRDLIDGDGCFNCYHRPSRAKKKNGRGRPAKPFQEVPTLNITGFKEITRAFKQRFGGSISPKAGVFGATVTGQRAIDAVQWLYEGHAPALARKVQLACNLGWIKEDC